VELAEDFSETIKARDRDVFSYQNLSQGERRRLDLAILFTWRHIANLKNSCSANTLILDEIDQGLDLEGFNIVMRLFRSLENTNIFITSHRENVHEYPFDKVITMVKKNQFSVIEEV
jgi:ABC-type multidrug transport system ATPase subunit